MASGRRQKRMGPAPFASFEDLSDETETSPLEIQATRLPGIHEDVTPAVTPARDVLAPAAPRIDISRASSSSHHEDSRDSTPERELFQGAPGARLGLAFKEEGALELRSSTEELDFQDPNDQQQQHRASVTIVSASSGGDLPPMHQRKDSQGSEYGGLLSISGRTSRLSSIGSQGSRVSGQSRLSVTSGVSRSPSPHKMLLETSFCGSKADPSQAPESTTQPGTTKVETEMLERVLLSRKHDPTEAILAEGISIECRRKIQPADSLVQLSPVLQHASQQEQKAAASAAAVTANHHQKEPKELLKEQHKDQKPSTSVVPPEKPARKSIVNKNLATEKPVSTDVIIKVDKPEEEIVQNDTRSDLIPGKIISESGVEYTFIPLKGPLPKDLSTKTNKLPVKKSTPTSKQNKPAAKSNNVPVVTSKKHQSSEPQYIRIKLKPDHMYTDEPQEESSRTKPDTLELSQDLNDGLSYELSHRDLSNGSAGPTTVSRSPKSPMLTNNTPSPSLSRKSSFVSLFRGKDYGTSPESPTVPASVRRKSRSRSKSSDRDRSTESTKSASDKSKHRSVFTLFKSKKSSKSKQSLAAETSPCRQNATSLHSLEFTFDRQPAAPAKKKYYDASHDADVIIIPLHSPSSERPPPLPLYADTPEEEKKKIVPEKDGEIKGKVEGVGVVDVSETVVTHRQSSSELEPGVSRTNVISYRQSSTSSENVVFSTNLGSDNEIFTTKLPKRRTKDKESVDGTEKDKISKQSSPISETKVSGQNLAHRSPTPSSIKSPTPDSTKAPTPEKLPTDDLDKLTVTTEHETEPDTSERATAGGDSSESENETPFINKKQPKMEDEELASEHERKGLVLQTDSFEDELPYVPTTLPQERSVAVPIVPIKQRASYEIRTCPIERPRSTTPINPSCLEDYCEDVAATTPQSGKLRISLPRDDSIPGTSFEKLKSPKKWTEFVPKHPSGSKHHQTPATSESAPPLPPRGAPKDWINFEEIPERRKPPKRIQTIPSRGAALHPSTSASSGGLGDEANVIYSYVNPEDCKCECHESGKGNTPTTPGAGGRSEEDEQPLLDRKSDSSPDSQAASLPVTKKKSTKSTNAFPHVATTRSS